MTEGGKGGKLMSRKIKVRGNGKVKGNGKVLTNILSNSLVDFEVLESPLQKKIYGTDY